MPIEYGANAPWLDNWPIYRQLWQGGTRNPGDELDLIPTGRSLTVQFRDPLGTVALAFNELQTGSPVRVFHKERGIVEIRLAGTHWNLLVPTTQYTCEIVAYGSLYDSFPFNQGTPNPGYENINGVEIYCSPREILELLGQVPGADVQTTVPLMGGWSLDARGYWVKTIAKTQAMYGLWLNDLHARQVEYADLALGSDRQWARVEGISTDTLYYKGPENLASSALHIETAFNRYVLRSIEESSAEFDRKTGCWFNQRRVYRELHRGKYRQNQVFPRSRWVKIDEYFRLDMYSYSRTLVRRYTEDSQFSGMNQPPYQANRLFTDSETGVITLTESFWDWVDWGNDVVGMRGLRGLQFATPGEVAIELTYTGGPAKVSTDVSEAVANMAAIRQAIYWQQTITQGATSISIGCANFNFGEFFGKWIQPWQQGADAIAGNYQRIEIEAF